MKCPVCGMDCVQSAKDILATLPVFFQPCPRCSMRSLDKRAPLPSLEYAPLCSCGKRFIDEVFAHIYVIMVEEGDLMPVDPLFAVGSPLVHPGYAMDRPPFLPAKSLVLLTMKASKKTAERLIGEVPELRGVVKTGNFVPGIASPDLNSVPRVYELLAGCDVRADIFPLRTGPLVIYKQQSLIHIEFPRSGYPKIRSVEQHVGNPPVQLFVDACCGVGTLGLTAACLGTPRVVMNDAWYASAFWSAFNLEVNREYLKIDHVKIFEQLSDLQKHPVIRDQIKIAEGCGDQIVEVYQGDFHELPAVLPRGIAPVTALDLFDKSDPAATGKIRREWLSRAGGEVFIP
ncbi:hypothetical protein [uncultured Methanoregula sp.]|uniref:hypothetical protein n=1 Tax=uncultured Methanoregula sp. TaxID=1005933 RepID=UPI002AAB7FA7|nr:hypothetical protein [uncultured Methanoregula sp.]